MTFSFFEYAANATAISGMFISLYWLLLRHNTRFEANRLYLMLSTLASLLLPVMRFPPPGGRMVASGSFALRPLAEKLAGGEADGSMASGSASFLPGLLQTLEISVLVISAMLVAKVLWALISTLRKIVGSYPGRQRLNGLTIFTVATSMQAYSFFRWIFLPVQAKNNEELWRTLLAHETCHARQWHSLDRLLLEFTTAVCWWNPFFHLIKRQLTLTHEYLADRAAVEEVNPQTFVRILVSQILESRNPVLFHHFFQSPIKLRIMMLSQRNSQFVQWIFIPILLVCTALFSAGTSGVAQTPLSKPLTVVIDAGHGGEDPGATAGKLREKDIALALAKAVHDAGKERNLTIALTRDKDELPVPGNKDESLKRRVEMVNSQGADITVSLHIATTTEKTTQSSGVLVFIPSNNTATLDESKLLASYLLNGLEGGPLPINTALQQRQDNIYILDKNPKPAVLLEIGYLNNPKDAQILSSKEKLSDIAQRIAAALEAYASAKK